MPDTFWIVKDPNGEYMMKTVAPGRNHAAARALEMEAYGNRGKQAWARMHYRGYRLVKWQMKERSAEPVK